MSDPETDAQDAFDQTINDHLSRPKIASVLTGWVVVAEWMDETGRRWLSRANSEDMAPWTRDGLLTYASNDDWEDPEDPDLP